MTTTTNLTDAQIVAAARRLISEPTSDGSFQTLEQCIATVRAHQELGLTFLERYGHRLKQLDPTLEASLQSWKTIAL